MSSGSPVCYIQYNITANNQVLIECFHRMQSSTGFPIHLFICSGLPQHQHCLPHIDFPFSELHTLLSLSLLLSQTHDNRPVCEQHDVIHFGAVGDCMHLLR